MAVVLNHLQLDALTPLPNAADLKDGFLRAPVTLSPAFSPSVTSYTGVVPAGATSVSLVASSFAKAGVKVDGVPGSLRTVALQAGGGAVLRATLHDQATGAQLAEYTVTLKRSEEADGGELVKIDHAAPVAAPSHGHSHAGVPCTHDHGVAPPAAEHAHAHGGVACTEDHGHGHGAKAAEAHGHAHGEAKAVAHAHSHGGAACTEDHGGAPAERPHAGGAAKPAHGHSHAEEKPAAAHGHSHEASDQGAHARDGHAHGGHSV